MAAMAKVYEDTCMLPNETKYEYSTPTASFYVHLCYKFRTLVLPCRWHHGYRLYIRSRKSLKLEKHKQMATKAFIWHPYSPIKFFWDCFSLTIQLMAFMYMPVQVFMRCPNPYDSFILFSDAVHLITTILNFITGRVDHSSKQVILNPSKIAISYIKNKFILDLISSLPLQLIQPYDRCEYPTHTSFFVFKLFRLTSIDKSWKSLSRQLDSSYMMHVVTTMVGRTAIFLHWMTYLHYQVPALCAHWYPLKGHVQEWMQRFRIISNDSIQEKYITNLYYVTGICIGAGLYNPVDKPAIPELLLSSGMGIVGLMYLTYIFTALIRLIVYNHFESYLFHGRLKELQGYLLFKRLPPSLQQKIQLFINYKFNGHYFNEVFIKNTVNEQIKQDINMFCCKRLVMNVPLFQDLPIALINMIIFSLTQLLYMPGEVVVKYGHPGSALYLIATGTVACMTGDGKEVAHLKDGAFFGEYALVNPGTPRAATVIALEITEIYKLTNKQFGACLQLCPRLKRRLEAQYRARARQPHYQPPLAPLAHVMQGNTSTIQYRPPAALPAAPGAARTRHAG